MSHFVHRLLIPTGTINLRGNPSYLNQSAIYRFIAEQGQRLQGAVLDEGCAMKLMPTASYAN